MPRKAEPKEKTPKEAKKKRVPKTFEPVDPLPPDRAEEVFAVNPRARAVYEQLWADYGPDVAGRYLQVMRKKYEPDALDFEPQRGLPEDEKRRRKQERQARWYQGLSVEQKRAYREKQREQKRAKRRALKEAREGVTG